MLIPSLTIGTSRAKSSDSIAQDLRMPSSCSPFLSRINGLPPFLDLFFRRAAGEDGRFGIGGVGRQRGPVSFGGSRGISGVA